MATKTMTQAQQLLTAGEHKESNWWTFYVLKHEVPKRDKKGAMNGSCAVKTMMRCEAPEG